MMPDTDKICCGDICLLMKTQNILIDNNELPKTNLMKAFLIYLFATVILYFYGPIEWKTRNLVLTFGLVFIYIIFLYGGYNYGKNRYIYRTKLRGQSKRYYQTFKDYYYLISLITIGLSLFSIQRILRLYGWSSISIIINGVFGGSYSDLYFAEKLALSGSEMYGGNLYSIVGLIFSPLTFIYVPMTLLLYKEFSVSKKIVGVVGIILWVVQRLSSGTMQGFFVIIVIIFSIFMIRNKRIPNKKQKGSIVRRRKALLILFFVFVLLVSFNFVMTNRVGHFTNFAQRGENVITYDGPIYNIVPETHKNLLVWTDFYICQGYYGMSLATTMDWTPMFGAGSSRWLCLELSSLISDSIYEKTYPAKIQSAGIPWSASANWHTAFTWFANDVGFIGVIIVMFLIGWLFVTAYYDAYRIHSPYAVGLFCLLVQMIIFLPCNNIVFADSRTLLPFIVYTIGLIMTRNNVRIRLRIK